MPGGSISAPLGFVGTYIYIQKKKIKGHPHPTNHKEEKKMWKSKLEGNMKLNEKILNTKQKKLIEANGSGLVRSDQYLLVQTIFLNSLMPT